MPVKELHRVESESGLQYKRGKFSNTESFLVNQVVQQYLVDHGITFDEFKRLFFESRGHNRLHDFFVTAAQQLEGRPVIHVYHYLRRQYHPNNWKGQWTETQDAELKRLFAIHGPKWETIGEQLGRFHVSCKDRYRVIRQSFNTGRWSVEEVERLRKAILEWRQTQPKDTAVWAWIAALVGTRSWIQCLGKYASSLESHMRTSPTSQYYSARPWTEQDDLFLVHAIYDLVVEDESEIVWGRLVATVGELQKWSPSSLARRWALLRRRVANERSLDMDTILETLMRSMEATSIATANQPDAQLELDYRDLLPSANHQ
jgi:hypothetical protein